MSEYAFNKNASFPKEPLLKRRRRDTRAGVLHLCEDLNYGDPARETVTLAVLTQRTGWRAMIASGGGFMVGEAERAAVKHVRVPLDRSGLLAKWRRRILLEPVLQKERPALIHAHGAGTMDFGCRLSLRQRLPLLIDLTQPLPDTSAMRRVVARMARTPCRLRVPTRAMIEHLISVFQLDSKKISHVPPGIDLQSFNAAAISAERLYSLSRLWRLPEQALVILMPMPIEPNMGHFNFLEALASLKDEKFYAIMVGDDGHATGMRQEIEKEVERCGLSGRVIMPESCPDWPAAFWLANVVIAPNTVSRGQNLELIGAQALGRPVIVTAVGANEEMVLKNETAWVLPPDNSAAIAKALREAAHMSTDQQVNLADNTRYFIEEKFPQANWFNGMMELYESLLSSLAPNHPK